MSRFQEVTPIVTYGGIDISYDERTNKWVMELNGRERRMDSLTSAKAAIDKPEPVKKKPFEKIPCYKKGWSDSIFEKGNITSVADTSGTYSSARAWFVGENGERSKESFTSLIEDTPENRKFMAEIQKMERQRTELSEKQTAVRKLLTTVQEPKDEA